ncbi:M24 family metallopeptidase [Longirhabdus pacifica]|uniref:M24 family metallopeptidase n=1 Tax=Longirhabdus pacifica TaxID=2305227 RepID=UPI001008B4A8|nr:Xaa-Pro peptidase family protein [Longirhabdus pacifica]
MEEARLARLRRAMEQHQYDAYFITNGYNRTYISGFTGSSGYVLVTKDSAVFFTDFRYMTQAAEQVKHMEIKEHGHHIMADVKEQLDKQNITSLVFEKDTVTYSQYDSYKQSLGESVKLIPGDAIVNELRFIKDENEINIMKEAALITDAGFEFILTRLRPGVSERQISLELETFMKEKGSVGSPFEIIIASGERSALPHGIASDRILQMNEFVKMDFGACYKGYCSDITRTVVLGTATEKHREIYDIVLEAQENALQHLKAGLTGKEGDALARDVITKYGYGDYFGHGTGHALGIEVHENPRLNQVEERLLQSGMAVTVEPGIYLPGFGGVRIEDDVIITDTGIRNLTGATKAFIEVN